MNVMYCILSTWNHHICSRVHCTQLCVIAGWMSAMLLLERTLMTLLSQGPQQSYGGGRYWLCCYWRWPWWPCWVRYHSKVMVEVDVSYVAIGDDLCDFVGLRITAKLWWRYILAMLLLEMTFNNDLVLARNSSSVMVKVCVSYIAIGDNL